jgi:uncharacterized protein YjbJ (UPF0337 family)
LFVRQRTDRNRRSAQLWTLLGESLSRRPDQSRRVLRHPAARNFHEHCIKTSAHFVAAPACRAFGGTAGIKGTVMDWNSAQANWQQFRCEVHANWGRLTSGHLDVIAGRRTCLANKIEEAYGVTGDEAERQIKSFEARNQHPRPVSFR